MKTFKSIILFCSLSILSSFVWTPLSSAAPALSLPVPPAINPRLQPKLYKFIPPPHYTIAPVSARRHFWLGLSLRKGFVLSSKLTAITASVGYQWEYFGVDLRTHFGSSLYDRISVTTDHPVSEFNPPPGNFEVERPRFPSNPWNFTLIEPGLSVTTRFLQDYVPLLSQKARFGLAYGMFTDISNSVKLTGILASFEGALQYQLWNNSPFAVELGLTYFYGKVKNEAELPITFLTSSFSVLYWF